MEKEQLHNKKNRDRLILIVCVLIFVLSAGYLLVKWHTEKKAQEKFEKLQAVATEVTETVETSILTELGIEDPKKALDWEKIKAENEDIYAWIYIPGTEIDYPILQHPTDDSYYLNHNLDGSEGYPGCIYTESINHKDFSDHNTVIYGHNMKNGSMFADLHEFEDETFFDEHRYVFIYTPDKMMVYDIFALYEFGDEHILHSYDCTSAGGFIAYLNMVFDDYKEEGNFRDDVTVLGQDRIITLSTCIKNKSENRLLLQAVCVGEE